MMMMMMITDDNCGGGSGKEAGEKNYLRIMRGEDHCGNVEPTTIAATPRRIIRVLSFEQVVNLCREAVTHGSSDRREKTHRFEFNK